MSKEVTIVGAGPAGLFCAYLLGQRGYTVHLYDQMSGVGKKFLVAGQGGLNLTHSEDLSSFAERYGKDHKLFYDLLRAFSPDDLRKWCRDLGVETFVGTSGRVFPTSFKAAQILRRWLEHLKSSDYFYLHLRHRLLDVTKERTLTFEVRGQEKKVQAQAIILALGGASWKKTGSDGHWFSMLARRGCQLADFYPVNCGFDIAWSDLMSAKVGHTPLKNIELRFGPHKTKGEVMLTPYGIEGGAVYALSRALVMSLRDNKETLLFLDLKPTWSLEQIKERYQNKSNKESMSSFLRKKLKLPSVAMTLIKECLASDEKNVDDRQLSILKNVPLRLMKARPLDEAISTGGGILMSEVNSCFELKSMPGVYAVGEMLDFDAPTGGYLLQGCFSTAYRAVQGLDQA